MMEDWRFRESPYVEQGGLIAYAGVPLRMQHESGEVVGLGSLCVASATGRDPLNKSQQQTLARLADWIVADMVKCTRARRQRERHRMAELLAKLQNDTVDETLDQPVLDALRTVYPDASISIQQVQKTEQIETDSRCPIYTSELENGVWEDTAYIDEFIANSNQHEPPADKVVRFVSARGESELGSILLVVGTKDFRYVFDDVDSWFVQSCASIITQRWQKRLLSEVMGAKDKFLRGVSHQLRTPIHGILGAAELLTEDLKSVLQELAPILAKNSDSVSPLQQSSVYLDTISTAGRELMSTVNSMITLNNWADIAMADRQYDAHSFDDLEKELAEGISTKTLRNIDHDPSLFFYRNLPKDCHGIHTDLNLFRDSILPLILNSVQNTPKGAVTVTMSMREDASTLEIDIEDTGCGIQSKDQQRIFQLYEKVGEHSTGAGLGLTLATKFSALLHGSVELVSSRVDCGSHFRVTFKEVDCIRSPRGSQTPPRSHNLPTIFHHLPSPSASVSSEYLTKFLVQHGLTLSPCPEDAIIVLDFIEDAEQRRVYYSSIPKGQVAICLIPASVKRGSLEPSPDNIVYVEGPFMASTLDLALERAEILLSSSLYSLHVDKESTELDVPCAAPTKAPADDQESNSDEGYRSMSITPSSSAQPRHDSIESTVSETGAACQLNEHGEKAPDPLLFPLPESPAKPRALLVDDNVVNLRILQMYCKKRGLPYCCATDGQEAVRVFSEQQYQSLKGQEAPIQLILMDLQMPLCDGIQATQQIRLMEKQAGWKQSVLLMVTGQDSPVDRTAASNAGADDYLVKPVGIKLLDVALKQFFPAFETG